MPRTEKIPGVFPTIEIERDELGFAQTVTIKGVMDELVVTARCIDSQLTPWLDIKFNGEDKTYG